ncbi:MAG: hypothetical protein RI897_521 [Verrucomicrobiota bacterium]|jgi:hypothetical protein
MISFGDLLVVVFAVSIVVTFVVVTRRFIQRAEQTEAAED